ncbi:MAG: hypothetical protein ACR2JC_06660 [Chloroflexota bacterium]
MLCSIRWIPFLAVLVVAVGLLPRRAVAGGSGPSGATGCPRDTVCDSSLGVGLVPPAGWQRLPPGNFPPPTLAWFVDPPLNSVNNIRLIIRSDGATRDQNDARAAATAADTLIGLYSNRVSFTRYAVHYGSAPGVLIRGLPGTPAPYVFIILGHQGALYSIIAPGSRLAADQQKALASLRFIRRIGPFPAANPPPPSGSTSVGRIPGRVFAGRAFTLTPANGLHRGTHTYSLWFNVRPRHGWFLTYRVPCESGKGRLVVDIRNASGRVVDRVLHRGGRALHVSQMGEITGVFRLDVHSRCSKWTVTVSGIAP